VRGQDHRPIGAFLEQFNMAFPAEVLISHQNDFVNQIAVELNRK
jgi:hypothetical protein